MTVEPATAPPGLPIDVHLARFDTAVARPDSIVVRQPDGRTEGVPVAWSGEEGVARFVALAEGVVEVRVPVAAGMTMGHFAAENAPPATDAWARLAGIATTSGGSLIPADALDDAAGGAPAFPWRILLGLVVALLAGTEWALRRLRGRA